MVLLYRSFNISADGTRIQLGWYLGIFDRKLRYFTADGQLVPTPQEAELRQRQAKEQALVEKEQALFEK